MDYLTSTGTYSLYSYEKQFISRPGIEPGTPAWKVKTKPTEPRGFMYQSVFFFVIFKFRDFSTPQQKSEKTGQFPTRGNLLEYL